MISAPQVIDDLYRIKTRLEKNPDTSDNQDSQMKNLWKIVSSIGNENLVGEIMQHHDYPELSRFLSKKWNFYISTIERRHSIAITRGATHRSILSVENYIGDVDEMVLLQSCSHGREFVMVGCGPFPETLMKTYIKANQFSNVVGIDCCADSLRLAQKIFSKCVKQEIDRNVYFNFADGTSYDFSSTSTVLLANGLRNKKNILANIAETMPDDGIILVRNPVFLAKMLYEDIFSNGLIENFRIVGSVKPSSLSETYALKKALS